MIKAEIIKSGKQWTGRANGPTFRAAWLDALRDELPMVAAEARRDVPMSPWSKEHLKNTVGWGIDKRKGQGYIKAGGTPAVWYAHLIERGFTDRAGRFHPGQQFMGKAIYRHSADILRSYRKHLDRRLRSG